MNSPGNANFGTLQLLEKTEESTVCHVQMEVPQDPKAGPHGVLK